jgi:cytochrome P450
MAWGTSRKVLHYKQTLILPPALSHGLFHILDKPEIFTRLRAELEAVTPDALQLPPMAVLEQLPYLSAVINEALRKSFGVASRSPRIQPYQAVELISTVQDPSTSIHKSVHYTVPPGYTVSMSAVLLALNPEIFPNPHIFLPERWLNSDGGRRTDLDKYLLSFSKGTRKCLGIKYVCLSLTFGYLLI